jgi:hypothetical protein
LYSFSKTTLRALVTKKKLKGKEVVFGKRAIKSFFQDIEEMNINIHSDEDILKIDGVREILGIINSAKLILQKNKILN